MKYRDFRLSSCFFFCKLRVVLRSRGIRDERLKRRLTSAVRSTILGPFRRNSTYYLQNLLVIVIICRSRASLRGLRPPRKGCVLPSTWYDTWEFFHCFFPWVLFHSRVTGACLVATDLIVVRVTVRAATTTATRTTGTIQGTSTWDCSDLII